MADQWVIALAMALRVKIAEDPEAGEVAIAAFQYAAQEAAGSFPQLSEIAACYAAGPLDPCPFCSSGDMIHLSEPQPVPAWVSEAQQLKAAAADLLAAVQLAMGPDHDGVLTIAALPGQPVAQFEYRPAIPRLSHAQVRNSIPLEGHRYRLFGSGGDVPVTELPPEESAQDRPRRRGFRLR
jgi:hypothetical protein